MNQPSTVFASCPKSVGDSVENWDSTQPSRILMRRSEVSAHTFKVHLKMYYTRHVICTCVSSGIWFSTLHRRESTISPFFRGCLSLQNTDHPRCHALCTYCQLWWHPQLSWVVFTICEPILLFFSQPFRSIWDDNCMNSYSRYAMNDACGRWSVYITQIKRSIPYGDSFEMAVWDGRVLQVVGYKL